jgi:hypothetical protein
MAIPVIDPTTSVLAYQTGQFFVYQPAATNTPTSWAAVGLPAGISINTTTGKISGAATEPGVFNITLTATNGDGTSAPLFLAMGIESAEYHPDSSIELDMALANGAVSNPAVDDDEPPLFGKMGDRLLVAIGLKKGNILQELAVAQVDIAVKEYESESLKILTTGVFEQVGEWDATRYLIVVYLDPTVMAGVLSSYEGLKRGNQTQEDADKDTFVDATAEIRIGILYQPPGAEAPQVHERSSASFKFRIARDMARPDLALEVDEE